MIKALQHTLDGNYSSSRAEFRKALEIIAALKQKGFRVNPQQEKSIQSGIRFSQAMSNGAEAAASSKENDRACGDILRQIEFMDNGGTVLQYDSEQVRNEIDSILHRRLVTLKSDLGCRPPD